MDTELKPILIIGCSGRKFHSEESVPAFDLYDGVMYRLLRSKLHNPQDLFEIVILSAKHGLIRASNKISLYEQQIHKPSNQAALDSFVTSHHKNARALIKKLAGDRHIYTLLSNNYLCAFKTLLGSDLTKALSNFKASYVSEGHRGIGDMRGRLCRIIELENKRTVLMPVIFRSGISNESELAYLQAGCAVGSSLAQTSTTASTKILTTLLTHLDRSPLFLDNGLIQAHNRNLKLDASWVFSEYLRIARQLSPAKRKNLYVVIPDDVHSNEEALRIIKTHASEIRQLIKLTNVIVPIHRSDDIRSHVQSICKIVRSKKLIAGIPCLTKPGMDFALSISDIDSIFSERRPNGEPLFKRCHFFGMSEKTIKNKLSPRLLVANMHGLSVSMDANRTTACFGKNRAGNIAEKQIAEGYIKTQVIQSNPYKEHNFAKEFHDADQELYVTADFYSMINEDDIFDWITIYNELMSEHEQLQITTTFSEDEIKDLVQQSWDLTSQKYVDHLVFSELKKVNWELFKHKLNNLHDIPPSLRRYEAIAQLFSEQTKTRVPVQMAFF